MRRKFKKYKKNGVKKAHRNKLHISLVTDSRSLKYLHKPCSKKKKINYVASYIYVYACTIC